MAKKSIFRKIVDFFTGAERQAMEAQVKHAEEAAKHAENINSLVEKNMANKGAVSQEEIAKKATRDEILAGQLAIQAQKSLDALKNAGSARPELLDRAELAVERTKKVAEEAAAFAAKAREAREASRAKSAQPDATATAASASVASPAGRIESPPEQPTVDLFADFNWDDANAAAAGFGPSDFASFNTDPSAPVSAAAADFAAKNGTPATPADEESLNPFAGPEADRLNAARAAAPAAASATSSTADKPFGDDDWAADWSPAAAETATAEAAPVVTPSVYSKMIADRAAASLEQRQAASTPTVPAEPVPDWNAEVSGDDWPMPETKPMPPSTKSSTFHKIKQSFADFGKPSKPKITPLENPDSNQKPIDNSGPKGGG
jgi:hypothetical protein